MIKVKPQFQMKKRTEGQSKLEKITILGFFSGEFSLTNSWFLLQLI